MDIVNGILNAIIGFLPDDPVYNYLQSIYTGLIDVKWINWLNWIFPVHSIIIVFHLWIGAVLVYAVIKLFMKGFTAFGNLSGGTNV